MRKPATFRRLVSVAVVGVGVAQAALLVLFAMYAMVARGILRHYTIDPPDWAPWVSLIDPPDWAPWVSLLAGIAAVVAVWVQWLRGELDEYESSRVGRR